MEYPKNEKQLIQSMYAILTAYETGFFGLMFDVLHILRLENYLCFSTKSAVFFSACMEFHSIAILSKWIKIYCWSGNSREMIANKWRHRTNCGVSSFVPCFTLSLSSFSLNFCVPLIVHLRFRLFSSLSLDIFFFNTFPRYVFSLQEWNQHQYIDFSLCNRTNLLPHAWLEAIWYVCIPFFICGTRGRAPMTFGTRVNDIADYVD